MTGFSAALRDALLIGDARASEESVRQIVTNQIRELDPQATPQPTGYFNHSWVPDFMIRWKDGVDRSLFLRFDVNHASFRSDLEFAGNANAPVFLDIAQPELHTSEILEPESQAEWGVASTEVMVTDHQALGALGQGVSENGDVRQATKQIVRGGRGRIDEPTAETVIDYYQRAAEILEPGRVRQAQPEALRGFLDVLEKPLSRIARLDLETELRTRWVRGGREPETFPSLEGWQLGDRSSDEIAEIVVALVVSDEDVADERWREIAAAISLDALGAAMRGRRRLIGGKVNDFLRVALTYWTAKWAWVGAVDEGSAGWGTLDWSLGGTSVELYLDEARVVFVDNGTRLNTMERPAELPRLEARLSTLGSSDAKGITVVTPEESVGLRLRASATETLGERLSQLMAEQADVRISGRIEALEVRVPGSADVVEVRFETGKAQSHTPVPVAALARLVAEFMVALPASRLELLEERTGRQRAGT
jgi:hypothetical protein